MRHEGSALGRYALRYGEHAMLTTLINIDVGNLERAEAFYTQAFDLRIGRRFGSGGSELLGANAPIYLLRKTAGSGAGNGAPGRRDYQRHWTPVHLDFVIDDLAVAMQRVIRAGARLEGEMRTANWGRIATFADPFGHGFCLIEFLGSGYDEIASAAIDVHADC
jgi:predicted enzyme related to lactoylglutathione lyase